MLPRLLKRVEFLRAARSGAKRATDGLVLQARRRLAGEYAGAGLRAGFTTSKKVGNAVARNRARRRLREAAEVVLATTGRQGVDYVLIGRTSTVTRPWPALVADLARAVDKVHAMLDGAGGRR